MEWRQETLVLLPNLPAYGEFLIVRVAGEYRFEPKQLEGDEDRHGLVQDYGHIMPVEPPAGANPIAYNHDELSADLRRSLTCRSRLWSLAHLREEVGRLFELSRSPEFRHVQRNRKQTFDRLLHRARKVVGQKLEEELDKGLEERFAAADLESTMME